MSRPATDTASPSALAPALSRWLIAHGADAGVLPDHDKDEAPVTPRALSALFEAAVDLVAEPHVGLRLPSELSYRRYDAVALATQAAATPVDVLRIHARYAPLVLPQLEASVEEAADAFTLRARVRGHPRGLGAPVEEYLVALVLGRCRRGLPGLAPRSAALVSARPRDLGPLYAALGTRDLAFGSEESVVELSRGDALRLLPGHDPTLVATAEHLATAMLEVVPRERAMRELVGAKIDAALPGPVSIDSVAAALHLSARTLHRRLEAEGTRFGEVLDGVREGRARRLLRETVLPLAEVAYRAGFADLATFSRAFKRWTGIPPGAFRAG